MRIQKNVGGLDRKLRAVLGSALVLAGLFLAREGVLIIIGLGVLGTSLLGFCPAYLPFGISTDKSDLAGPRF